jgi:hypothetical protein
MACVLQTKTGRRRQGHTPACARRAGTRGTSPRRAGPDSGGVRELRTTRRIRGIRGFRSCVVEVMRRAADLVKQEAARFRTKHGQRQT